MTLPALLTHVAARWAATREAPACGWVPDESEIDMTATIVDCESALGIEEDA